MAKIGLFFGSTEGTTERIAGQVQEAFGGEDVVELHNVESASADDMAEYDFVILAASTWEIGELQEDWDNFIDELDDVEFDGKTVAYIGTGDADGYPDTFIDAIGLIHEKISDKDVKLVGTWPTEDYEFEDSKAIIDDKFIGLAIDEDNEADKTADRIAAWVAQVKEEAGL